MDGGRIDGALAGRPAQEAVAELVEREGNKILGLGLRRRNIGQARAAERLPYVDDGQGPRRDDVLSWETLRLEYTPGRHERSESPWDLGAYPRPSQPLLHW